MCPSRCVSAYTSPTANALCELLLVGPRRAVRGARARATQSSHSLNTPHCAVLRPLQVSDHAGTFEQYSTGLVGVAPRLVGHAMSLPAAGVGGASGSAPHAVTALPAPRMGKGSVALVRAACVRGCTLLLTWSRVLEEEAAEDPADGDDGAPAATAQGGGGGGAADQPAPAAPQAAQIQGNGGGELAQQPGPAAVGDAAGPSASAPAALLALSSPAPPSVSSVQAQVGSTLVRWARQADRERDAAAERHSHGRGGSASAADAAGSGGAAIALSGAMRAADVERGAALAGEEARLYGAVPEMLPVQEVVRLVHVSPPALAWPVIRGSGSGGAAGMGGGAGAALQPAVVRLCVVSAGPLRTRVLVLAAAAAAAEVRAGGIVTSGTGMMAAAVLKEVGYCGGLMLSCVQQQVWRFSISLFIWSCRMFAWWPVLLRRQQPTARASLAWPTRQVPVVLHSGVQDIELDLADVVQVSAWVRGSVGAPPRPGEWGWGWESCQSPACQKGLAEASKLALACSVHFPSRFQ